jgi:hypothetical protein
MAEAIADAGDQKAAGFDIQVLEDIVDAPSAEPVSEVIQAVNAAYRLAVRYDGTSAERIKLVQRGSTSSDGTRRGPIRMTRSRSTG